LTWDGDLQEGRHSLLPVRFFNGGEADLPIIINVCYNGVSFLTHGGSSCCVSKLVVCWLTKFLASDYEDQSLIAIAVHPVVAKTDTR
jgi:hypothetical protein